MEKNQIKQLISECGEIEITKISDESSLIRDLGFDSIMFLQLIVALEERIGMELQEDDLSYEKVATVNDVYNIIQNSINQNKNVY